MAQTLTALKCIITQERKPMTYPDFNSHCRAVLDDVQPGMDWCNYIDMFAGPHLDKICKMGECDAAMTRPDHQFILYLVPHAFAVAAVAGETAAGNPDRCVIIAEADAEAFYNDRAHAHEAEEQVNADIVNSIRAKRGFAGAMGKNEMEATDWATLSPAEKKALDPEDPAPGIVTNVNKYFDTFCANRDIEITVVE